MYTRTMRIIRHNALFFSTDKVAAEHPRNYYVYIIMVVALRAAPAVPI